MKQILFPRTAMLWGTLLAVPTTTHHAEVGNLLSLYPKIHRLNADAKEYGGFADADRHLSVLGAVEQLMYRNGFHGNLG